MSREPSSVNVFKYIVKVTAWMEKIGDTKEEYHFIGKNIECSAQKVFIRWWILLVDCVSDRRSGSVMWQIRPK